MDWESRMSAGPLYLGGGERKEPSLLFHLKNNTSLCDMETKLYTHINKTLAMCLIKKLRKFGFHNIFIFYFFVILTLFKVTVLPLNIYPAH